MKRKFAEEEAKNKKLYAKLFERCGADGEEMDAEKGKVSLNHSVRRFFKSAYIEIHLFLPSFLYLSFRDKVLGQQHPQPLPHLLPPSLPPPRHLPHNISKR